MERIQGYRDALEQYRLPFEERLIKYGDYTFESGYRAIMELEREGTRFTGVLAANDTMALGAIKALKELTYATRRMWKSSALTTSAFLSYVTRLWPPFSSRPSKWDAGRRIR